MDVQPSISQPATVLITRNQESVLLHINGRFNFEMHTGFRQAIHDIFLAVGEKKSVVIDMRKTEHIDSSGLGMLLLLHHEARARGVSVVIGAVQPHVRRVLETANFPRLFKMDG